MIDTTDDTDEGIVRAPARNHNNPNDAAIVQVERGDGSNAAGHPLTLRVRTEAGEEVSVDVDASTVLTIARKAKALANPLRR